MAGVRPVTLVEMPPLIVTEPVAVSEMAASDMPMKDVLLVEVLVNTTLVPYSKLSRSL